MGYGDTSYSTGIGSHIEQMTRRMTLLRMMRYIIPLLAGCAILGAVVSGLITLLFLAKAVPTTGIITASQTMESESGETLYQPTFTFNASGRDYTITPLSYVAPSPGDVGEHVTVLYDPRNPHRASIDSFIYTWGVPVMLLIFGIVFGLIHFTIVYISRFLCGSAPKNG